MVNTMTEPISTRNLDRYGSAELPWTRPRDIAGPAPWHLYRLTLPPEHAGHAIHGP
jgi:hypothetical protein